METIAIITVVIILTIINYILYKKCVKWLDGIVKRLEQIENTQYRYVCLKCGTIYSSSDGEQIKTCTSKDKYGHNKGICGGTLVKIN